MERFDLRNVFEVIRCADDVTHTKPHPELYLSAASALGVSPSEAVAFEDSPNGALAANRAGVFCVVVPNPMTRHLSFETPDKTLSSLDEIPLASLLAEILTHPCFN